MTGSKDLPPSQSGFLGVFYHNQFEAKPQWPAPNTSLKGQTAIVTGSNTGLGYEAASQLLDLQLSHIVLGVRSLEKGKAAAKRLALKNLSATIDVWQLDMCSFESVQEFTKRADTQLKRIDFVLLNAGLHSPVFRSDGGSGPGEVYQVNYLSTMLLTVLMLPMLKAKHQPQNPVPHLSITNAALTLAATFPEQKYNPILPAFSDPKAFNNEQTYNSSKLLAHMFLWNLVDYVSSDDVIVSLADPAWCKGTELIRDVKGPVWLFLQLFKLLGRTPEVGASCLVDALVNKGKESHGCFLMSWKIHP